MTFITALYRYGMGFYNSYARAFKRYTDPTHQKEKGYYAGITLNPSRRWQVAATGHYFCALEVEPQWAVDQGHKWLIYTSYRCNHKTKYRLHYTHRATRDHTTHQNILETHKAKTEKAHQNNFKLHADYIITPDWQTKITIQYINYMLLGHTHHGYSLSNIQQWGNKERRQFTFQMHYFQTENFATRLYFYEPQPLFKDTKFKSYYGTGMMTTCLMYWKLVHWMSWDLQYKGLHLFKRIIRIADLEKGIKPPRTVHKVSIQCTISF